jgi:hypothetical protein
VRQLDDGQLEQAVSLIESLAWGDIDGDLRTMERALRLAMKATSEDFRRWESEADTAGFSSELSVDAYDVAQMSPDWRLAYVARLLRTVALAYGVGTEFGGKQLVGEEVANSPAGLLRGLNDISTFPVIRAG